MRVRRQQASIQGGLAAVADDPTRFPFGRQVVPEAQLGDIRDLLPTHVREHHVAAEWLMGRVDRATAARIEKLVRADRFYSQDSGDVYGEIIKPVPLDKRPVQLPPLQIAAVQVRTTIVGSRPGVSDPWTPLEKALASRADIVMAPEWYFRPCNTPREYTAVLNRLLAMSRGSSALLVPGTIPLIDRRFRYRNIALAICNGRVLFAYGKRSLGGDETIAQKTRASAWEPGGQPGIFTWRNLKVGLEICADHSGARLRWDQFASPSAPPLALQLVVSAGMAAIQSATAVGEGGGIVCVDGSSPQRTQTHRLQNGQLELRGAAHKTFGDTARIETLRL